MIVVRKKYPGFIFTELAVAFMVFGLILAGFAVSLYGFSKFNRYLLTKQHCVSAATALLDSITATGEMIDNKDIQRLWPDVNITTEISNGTGQWEGLKLINITAVGKMPRKEVKVELSRYVLP